MLPGPGTTPEKTLEFFVDLKGHALTLVLSHNALILAQSKHRLA
jgi:hypothetical protein